MGSFYGNIKTNSRISLVFDKTYPNRAAMEEAISKIHQDKSNKADTLGDGVYNTRYVLINYGERRYSPYKSIDIQDAWHQENVFTNECPTLYTYKISQDIQKKNYSIYNTNDDYIAALRTRPYGEYCEVKKSENYDDTIQYYIKKSDVLKDDNRLTPDGIDENCEYAINKEIDKKEYQDNYDHTVWQKIWCSVGSNSTITEKYIMVSSLDAKAPKFEAIVDAPSDNDEYQIVSIKYEDGNRNELSLLNTYYYKSGEKEIGFGDSVTTINLYEELPIEFIKNVWNTKSQIVLEAEAKIKTALQEVITFENNNKNTTLFIENNLSFSEEHNGKINGADAYLTQLENQKDVAEKLGQAENVELYNGLITRFNTIQNNYNAVYLTWQNAIDNAIIVRKNEIPRYQKNQNEIIPIKDVYIGPYFQYKEILSDLVIYDWLVDETGNELIKSQDTLDSYLNSIGNIFISNNYSGAITTYDGIYPGWKYQTTDGIGTRYRYYHKTFQQSGYISKELFDRLKVAPQQIYTFKNNKLIEITNDDEYDSTQKYFERIKVRVNGGPHIDTFRSTDLDYKLHIPRNWKFDTYTKFHYNKAGFNPERRNYIESAENQIYLTKTSSGELYPVHMDMQGQKLLNQSEEGVYSNATHPFDFQLSEAGYYVNGALKYAKQIDQRTFDINLPELGNVVSDLWDLVYPRGIWEEYSDIHNGADDPNAYYNNKYYLNGDLYYKSGSYYIQVSKNDILDPDITYYIFKEDNKSPNAPRYLFVGNDRDKIHSDDYPTTLVGLIRYIYKILGLKTDNDYYDIPSEESLWGLYNGISELLGKYSDNYSIDKFLPLRTYYNRYEYPSQETLLQGDHAGDITFGYIQNSKTFDKLHNDAFGPLYVLDDESPIWHQVLATEKFNPSLAYFIKATPNDLTDPKKKDYIIKDATIFDDNNQIIDTINLICDKDFNNDVYINEFKDGVIYYKPDCLYKKASVYSPTIQYYRNLNSLWALLREFQKSRDNYQNDWEEDKPGIPGHIWNRPKVIFSDLNYADKYNTYYQKIGLSYIQLTDIKSQAILDTYLTDEKFKEIGHIYYQTIDENGITIYIKIGKGSNYNSKLKYYKLSEPADTNLSDSSIGARWSGISIKGSNSGGAINYDPDSGLIGGEGQSITLVELTDTRLMELIVEVNNE